MFNIVVPALGESIVEARVARWLKKPGDPVAAGEPVVELETEKTNLELSSDESGVVSSLARQEGDDVKIGELLAVIDDSVAPPASRAAAQGPEGTVAKTPPAGFKTLSGRSASRPEQTVLVQRQSRFAEGRDQIDSGGFETASTDAIAPKSQPPIAPASTLGRAGDAASSRAEERVRMTKRRQTIARRLVEAQHTAAMLTTFNEVDMSAVVALRERQKDAFKKEFGVGLGIASFFIKSAIAALRAFPALNAEIQGDEIVYKHYYDIGVAVGAEGGLVVPVIRDADRLSFPQIELAIRDFATRAGTGTLTLEDLRGGTFTITNGGVFGSLLSTPILNPPQVGILGLHKIQDRVVPVGGQAVIRPMMYVALSYDHRIVDGREAVQFLVKIKDYVEEPGRLLLEA